MYFQKGIYNILLCKRFLKTALKHPINKRWRTGGFFLVSKCVHSEYTVLPGGKILNHITNVNKSLKNLKI